MPKYTYTDHGNHPPGQYAPEVVIFECHAEDITEADKMCRQAGYNPTLWHVLTHIEKEKT
jgi:hypothetical protein